MNKLFHVLSGFLLLLFSSLSCSRAAAQNERPPLTNTDLDKKLAKMLKFSVPLISVDALRQRSAKEKVYVFDTRELKEYQVSHIPDAQYLGYDDFKYEKLREVHKDATIVVYCSVGYRSEKIGERILSKGYTQVFNLYGSIFEWAEQGFPLQNAKKQSTTALHTYNREWGKWIKGKEIRKIW